jgi:DNA primase
LQEVGLLSERKEVGGFYDRFRDRVMFPIRDVRGQTVGFGGRILPGSPYATRNPKYYNSADTPLFNKSELLYGLDLARHAGSTEGYLAVVEGVASTSRETVEPLNVKKLPVESIVSAALGLQSTSHALQEL